MQTSLENIDPRGNGHAGAPREEDFPKTLDMPINPPVDLGGEPFTSMHLREPTFQEVRETEALQVRDAFGRATDASSRLYQLALISKVTGIPRPAIDKMRISEVNRAYAFLMESGNAGPATGEN